jgi:acyl-[acyl-carrier-protein]-phospholipid O-acyltransferase/long-chain-fatty-acid--[acyl-carrier-protein] ligase
MSDIREDRRSFYFLTAAMFQGAFSDNMYRLILIMMSVDVAKRFATSSAEANTLAQNFQSFLSILFILPFVLAVSFAGWMADRYSKTSVVRWTKLLEVGVMALGAGVFALGPDGLWFGGAVLFLMGLQSALFSPARYGIMAEQLPSDRLGWGNGLIQGLIFFAIVLGTVLGPVLYEWLETRLWIAGLVLVALGVVGYFCTLRIAHVPAAAPNQPLLIDPVRPVLLATRHILADLGERWSTAGMICWWMAAILLQGGAVQVAINVLGLSPAETGLALLPIVIAQGIGCFISSHLCRDRVELGLVPFGALGMFVMALITWALIPTDAALREILQKHSEVPSLYLYGIPLLLSLTGFTMGFFIVPLEAFMNQRCDPKERGSMWAALNVLTAIGMMVGAGLAVAIVYLRSSVGDIFLAVSLLMGAAGFVICWKFPRLPLRGLVLLFLKSRYRVVVKGIENVPAEAGCLLAPNHQSYIDGILIASTLDRPVRFIMSSQVYHSWFVYPFARLTETIPIEADQSPRQLVQALRKAADHIRAGGIICIFPEGQLSRNGMMMPFRRGMERIMKDLDAPIVPVAIDGAYDTNWAMRRGERSTNRNGGLIRRGLLAVHFGTALPAHTPGAIVRQRVGELLHDAFGERRCDADVLHRMGIRSLRRRAFEKSYSDHNTPSTIPNFRILAGVAILGGRLRSVWGNDECVGLLLPPSNAALILNIAASAGGRIPVNLNYTSSAQILAETCRAAGIKVIVTSRLFVEKAKLTLPEGTTVVYLEDERAKITSKDQVLGILRGMFFPISSLERYLGRTVPATLDDVATLIFSSGSTGQPKGVMLTHWNLVSNIAGTLQYVETEGNDVRFLGILPFFHSFGYNATLWLPLYRGIGVSYHPSPLDSKVIGALVEKYKVTHLFGTPTFLSNYARRVEPGQFGSLRFVLTGAEKLKEFIVIGFKERFGIEPIEGFGCTECAPTVSLNGQDWRGAGIYQVGVRRGTVGQPIPAMVVRVVGLDDGLPVPPGESGMLLVRGHSVMKGYYGMPEKTAEALVDGWYKTGDVASLDEDGFLTIRDRLARFSKIGGEMVPHVRIEEALQQASGAQEPVFAVTSLPDDKKGERLAVLYTLTKEKAKEACDALGSADLNLPSLWLPKWADFVKVDAIPILGSGKLDLRTMKTLAADGLKEAPQPPRRSAEIEEG